MPSKLISLSFRDGQNGYCVHKEAVSETGQPPKGFASVD